MKVRCFNIQWDISSDDEDDEPPVLPSEVIIEIDYETWEEDGESVLADELSDLYGWCIYDLEYQKV